MPATNLYWRTIRPAEGFYTSEVLAPPQRLPVRTFLPTGYEPNYAYPLVVFLHAQGGNEQQILQLAPRLSRRNYVCIGLRGPFAAGTRPDGRRGYSWGPDGPCPAALEDYIIRAVEQTRRNYHVHSERIYLAGFCEGATLAYRLALTFPEKFAGVISLNGSLPRGECPLILFKQIRGLRVLIGHGIANALVPLATAEQDHRLLFTAGLAVRMHSYAATHLIHADMLRDADRWLMGQVTAED